MPEREEPTRSRQIRSLELLIERVNQLLERTDLWSGPNGTSARQRLLVSRERLHNKLLKLAHTERAVERARGELQEANSELRTEIDAAEQRAERQG